MVRHVLVAVAACALLASCREAPFTPDLAQGRHHPADPQAPGGRATYQSVTSGMRDYKVVTPRPWGQSNEQVAPKSSR